MLYCTVLTVLYGTVLYCTALYCTVLCCNVLYCTGLCRLAVWLACVSWPYCVCTVLCCTVLYSTILYCTVLYCIVLYCTVLYCTVLTRAPLATSCFVHGMHWFIQICKVSGTNKWGSWWCACMRMHSGRGRFRQLVALENAGALTRLLLERQTFATVCGHCLSDNL